MDKIPRSDVKSVVGKIGTNISSLGEIGRWFKIIKANVDS